MFENTHGFVNDVEVYLKMSFLEFSANLFLIRHFLEINFMKNSNMFSLEMSTIEIR